MMNIHEAKPLYNWVQVSDRNPTYDGFYLWRVVSADGLIGNHIAYFKDDKWIALDSNTAILHPAEYNLEWREYAYDGLVDMDDSVRRATESIMGFTPEVLDELCKTLMVVSNNRHDLKDFAVNLTKGIRRDTTNPDSHLQRVNSDVLEYIKGHDIFWLHDLHRDLKYEDDNSKSYAALVCRNLAKTGVLTPSERRQRAIQYMVTNPKYNE